MSNSPLYFSFLYLFFHHSSCRKNQFTVLILKFGTQDFTDAGLLKIRLTRPHWFCRCGFAFINMTKKDRK